MKERTKTFITVCIAVAVGIVISLLAMQHYHADKWYDGTYINGEDVSGMTLEESEEIMTADYALEITGLTISGEDIGLVQETSQVLEELFEAQHGTPYWTRWSSYIDMEASFDEGLLSDIVTEWAEGHPAEDAYIEWDGEEFVIVEDTAGIDTDEAIALISEAISSLESSLILTEGCYEQAEVTAEDLSDVEKKANSYAQHQITINITDSITQELSAEELHEWVTIDGTDVSFDEDALYEWIEDLCLGYKTVGTERAFTTHDGEEISISGGDYGWQIDYDALCEDIMDVISGDSEDVSIDVTWSSSGYSLDDDSDWDTDNYVEVDISEQMVYVYKDGELAFSCICVTGLPNGERDTTTGIWYIKDKKESYTMTSTTYGYTTPTKYWVRVTWTGIGFHYMNRSDWSSWSPSLYKTAGSHGCINLTLENAKSVYDLVSIGEAVFIHE